MEKQYPEYDKIFFLNVKREAYLAKWNAIADKINNLRKEEKERRLKNNPSSPPDKNQENWI